MIPIGIFHLQELPLFSLSILRVFMCGRHSYHLFMGEETGSQRVSLVPGVTSLVNDSWLLTYFCSKACVFSSTQATSQSHRGTRGRLTASSSLPLFHLYLISIIRIFLFLFCLYSLLTIMYSSLALKNTFFILFIFYLCSFID